MTARSIMRRGLVIALLVAAAVAAGIALVPRTHVNTFVERLIIARAADHNITLRAKGLDLSLLGAQAEEVSLFWPHRFLSLSLQNIRGTPRWTKILGGKMAHSIQATLYEGALNANVTLFPFSSRLTADGTLHDLALARHNQLNGLGITAGTLSVKARDIVVQGGQVTAGHVTVIIAGLEKPHETSLDAKRFGLPFPIILPAISNLNASIEAAITAAALRIAPIDVRSSLAEIHGSCTVPQLPTGALEGTLRWALTKKGTDVIGPFLPLISQGRLTDRTANFEVTVAGTSAAPRLTWRPLGGPASANSEGNNEP